MNSMIKVKYWFYIVVGILLICCSTPAEAISWNSAITVHSAASTPGIAVKSDNTPCIVYDRTTGDYDPYYTENLGTTAVRMGNGDMPDVAIDLSNNAHVVWHLYEAPEHDVVYRAQSNGTFGAAEKIADVTSVGAWPQIAIDPNNVVHTVWNSSIYRDSISYRQKSGGSWAAIEPINSTGKELGFRITADSSGTYVAHIPKTTQWLYGPYLQTRDSAGNWTEDKLDSEASIGYANMQSGALAWRGSDLDLAVLDDVTSSDETLTGRVFLYLDILSFSGTELTPIEVFNDYPGANTNATASAVTMAIDESGNHYVIFSASDGSDNEIYMKEVSASGTLIGSLQQLTDNAVEDTYPEAVWGTDVLHLVWRSGAAVNYMSTIAPPRGTVIVVK